MKCTILADNHMGNIALPTEHGLSVLLETACYRILLDTGGSDLFIRNAEQMGIDLSQVDYVFISHGHSDHAGGLRHFLRQNKKAHIIVSPHALTGQFFSKRQFLHDITPQWPTDDLTDRLILPHSTCEIAKNLHVIADISHFHPLPKANRHLFAEYPNKTRQKDDFRHELALWVDGFLFTGCAHNGLENILAACLRPVHTVMGGFHLIEEYDTTEEVTALAQRLLEKYPHTLFLTGHCTSDNLLTSMQEVMGRRLRPFSAGKQITLQENH